MTAPFLARALNDLTNSVQHVHEVWAYDASATLYSPIKLDLVTATINYDEERTPLIELNGAMQVPSQEILDFLDPRRDIRIFVLAGYVYSDGFKDVWKIVDLGLRERTVRRPQDDLVIRAVSDEQKVEDYRFTTVKTWTPASDGGLSIRELILNALGPLTPVMVTLTGKAFVPAGETETLEPGASIWSQIHSIEDRIGARTYEDGLGTFWVTPQPTSSGAASASLSVGDTGTITGSETLLSTENFANFIMVEFTDGDVPVRGWAEMKTGDFGTNTVGRKAKVVSLPGTGSTSEAEAAAGAMLWRSMSRGRRMSLECAQAMYWLRPGQTVTVQLPTGPQERHLISTVEFDIPTGTMNIHTRLPENVVITTGE